MQIKNGDILSGKYLVYDPDLSIYSVRDIDTGNEMFLNPTTSNYYLIEGHMLSVLLMNGDIVGVKINDKYTDNKVVPYDYGNGNAANIGEILIAVSQIQAEITLIYGNTNKFSKDLLYQIPDKFTQFKNEYSRYWAGLQAITITNTTELSPDWLTNKIQSDGFISAPNVLYFISGTVSYNTDGETNDNDVLLNFTTLIQSEGINNSLHFVHSRKLFTPRYASIPIDKMFNDMTYFFTIPGDIIFKGRIFKLTLSGNIFTP